MLPFTVILTWLVLKKPSSPAVISCCVIVFFGFMSGMFLNSGDGAVSGAAATYPVLGPFSGLVSSLTTAVHAVVIKNALDVVGGRTMDLVWWNNVLSAGALAPLVLLTGELGSAMSLFSADATESSASAIHTFIWGSIITGFFGFLINIAGFLQIKVTSPITHMVSGAVRGVLQTILAVMLFGDTVTFSRLVGIFLILAGSTGYTWVRNKETSAPATDASKQYQPAPRHDPDAHKSGKEMV